jgi:hypothetical protein
MRQRVCWYTWWLDGGGLPPSHSLFLLAWDSRCHSRFNCVLNFVFISILALDNLNGINVDFNAFWSFLFAISSLSVLFHLFFVSNLVLVLFIVVFFLSFLSYLFFNFPLYISFHWNFVSKFCLYSFYCHFFLSILFFKFGP